MNTCDKLAELLAGFEADGNEAAAAGIRAAMTAAGCTPSAESGGTGNGPPDDGGGHGPG